MKDFLQLLKERVVVFDGAMGTSIQNKLAEQTSTCNEHLNTTDPQLIASIHADFLTAGADVIETNTFGALPYLLKEYNLEDQAIQINQAAVRLALEVARSFTPQRYVSGSMGPGTKLPTLSQITYEQLYKDYLLQAVVLLYEGVDLLQIETGQDPLQMKIALKAALDAKEAVMKQTPIFLQATLQDNGQMLVGTDLRTFINTFKAMPVAGLGINCGTGPQHIEGYVKVISENCPKYISVLPNAGLPTLVDGKLSYDLTPTQFGEICSDLVKKYRINAIGGCCGTTHHYIAELARRIATQPPKPMKASETAYLTSLYASQEIKAQPAPLIIGERANVNGSKKFKTLLTENNWDEMVEVCLTQQEEGAHVLDICLTSLGRDEVADFATLIPLLNKTVSTPLMIDSTTYEAVEAALQHTAGKSIVNSVNFEHGEDHVVKYITLCRDLNAALICLTIDETGMATTFEKKIEIVNRFLGLCKEHRLPLEQVFIDCLTFALSTGDDQYRNTGSEAIRTIDYLRNNHPQISTVMGISNVSFGLKPKTRKVLNSVFLYECVKNGLTATIIDPSKIIPIDQIPQEEIALCENLIYNHCDNGDPLHALIDNVGDGVVRPPSESVGEGPVPPASASDLLRESVIKGRQTNLPEYIEELLKTTEPLHIINQILIPAMQEVGTLFEKGRLQLPFVLKSAEIMKKAVDLLKPHMSEQSSVKQESILLATVQGDVHDIGKNLVQIIVENNGYKVIDIGVKQTPQNIYDAIMQYNPTALGLSALLIKSTEYMRETLTFLKAKGVSIPVICGGAALNEAFVSLELQRSYDGAITYGKDAFAGLRFMQGLIDNA